MRPYLSWSQLKCFEDSPKEYIERYVYGKQLSNKYIEFGKQVAQAMEHREEQHDPAIEILKTHFKDFPSREHKITATVSGVKILSIMDGFDEAKLHIGEYKTGKSWDKSRVEQDGQLTFYAMAVHAKYKKLPKRITLYWAETIEDGDQMALTGRVEAFETSRSIKDVKAMADRVGFRWKQIQALIKNELKKV